MKAKTKLDDTLTETDAEILGYTQRAISRLFH